MEWSAGTLFLSGALFGVACAAVMTSLGRRRRRPHERDPLYAAARYAALTQVRRYGKVTIPVVADALEVKEMTAERYLERMVRDGLMESHGREAVRFYTRV